MRLLNSIILNNIKNKKILPYEVFSYGKFIRENPKATREERKKAIKKFLDATR
jgi:hypothetical protein